MHTHPRATIRPPQKKSDSMRAKAALLKSTSRQDWRSTEACRSNTTRFDAIKKKTSSTKAEVIDNRSRQPPEIAFFESTARIMKNEGISSSVVEAVRKHKPPTAPEGPYTIGLAFGSGLALHHWNGKTSFTSSYTNYSSPPLVIFGEGVRLRIMATNGLVRIKIKPYPPKIQTEVDADYDDETNDEDDDDDESSRLQEVGEVSYLRLY